MPDITMCKEKDCPKSKECYRFLAKPHDLWQAYLDNPEYDKNGCKLFWKDKTENKQ